VRSRMRLAVVVASYSRGQSAFPLVVVLVGAAVPLLEHVQGALRAVAAGLGTSRRRDVPPGSSSFVRRTRLAPDGRGTPGDGLGPYSRTSERDCLKNL